MSCPQTEWRVAHSKGVNFGGIQWLGRLRRDVRQKVTTPVSILFLSFLFGSGLVMNGSGDVSRSSNYFDWRYVEEYTRSLNPTISTYLGLLKYSWVGDEGGFSEGIDRSAFLHVGQAREMMHEWFDNYCADSKMLSISEVWDQAFANGSSSPGYPWTYYGFTDKNSLRDRPDFRDFMARYINQCRAGDVVTPLFAGSAKDEIRETEKVSKGKVRLFMGGPVEFHLWSLMLFSDQMQKMRQSRFTTPFQVGINKFAEWDRIGKNLHKFPNIFSMDVKSMDSRVRNILLWEIYKMRIRWLRNPFNPPEVASYVETHAKQYFSKCLVMPDGEVYGPIPAVASGHLLTNDDDTLVTMFVICLFWSSHFEGTTFALSEHVYMVNFGDDWTFSCSDEVLKVFNPVVINQFCGKLCFEFEQCAGMQFLGHVFYETCLNESVIFVPKPVEVFGRIAALIFPNSPETPQLAFTRAYGHYIDGYWETWFSKMLYEYMAWLKQNFQLKESLPLTDYIESLYAKEVTVKPSMRFVVNAYEQSAVCELVVKGIDSPASTQITCDELAIRTVVEMSSTTLSKSQKRALKKKAKMAATSSLQSVDHAINVMSRPKAQGVSVSSASKLIKKMEKKKMRVMSAPNGRARSVVNMNSDYYVKSLFDPEGTPGVRIPDKGIEPTGAPQYSFKFPINAYYGADFGTWFGCIVMHPSVKNTIWVVTGYSSGLADWTWTAYDLPEYSEVVTRDELYRVVSGCMTVKDSGAEAKFGANFICDSLATNWASNTHPPLNYVNLLSYKDAKMTTSNNIASVNKTCQAWVPLEARSLSGVTQISGQDWRPPNTDYVYDNCVVIGFWAKGDASNGPSDNVTAKITLNIEDVPFDVYKSGRDLKTVVGDPGRVAETYEKVIMALSKKGVSPNTAGNGSARVADDGGGGGVFSNLGSSVDSLISATTQIPIVGDLLTKGFGWLGSFFKDNKAKHELACALQVYEMSPFILHAKIKSGLNTVDDMKRVDCEKDRLCAMSMAEFYAELGNRTSLLQIPSSGKDSFTPIVAASSLKRPM